MSKTRPIPQPFSSHSGLSPQGVSSNTQTPVYWPAFTVLWVPLKLSGFALGKMCSLRSQSFCLRKGSFRNLRPRYLRLIRTRTENFHLVRVAFSQLNYEPMIPAFCRLLLANLSEFSLLAIYKVAGLCKALYRPAVHPPVTALMAWFYRYGHKN